jgi:sulfur carrier protein ThiS
MKFQILRDVPSDTLLNRLPSKYQHIPWPALLSGLPLTVLIFKSQRDEKRSGVVMSRTVKQALKRLELADQQKIVAVGADFTLESRVLLEERSVEVVSRVFFGWTDESYLSIKNS